MNKQLSIIDRYEMLVEENRQLRELLVGPPRAFPLEWRLSPAETRILRCLAACPDGCSRERLEIAASDGRERDPATLKAQIWGLRQKLSKFDVFIETYYGLGYVVTGLPK